MYYKQQSYNSSYKFIHKREDLPNETVILYIYDGIFIILEKEKNFEKD